MVSGFDIGGYKSKEPDANETTKNKARHFLTNNTAEGLRVTLTSTLEICTYLKEKYGIRYILTEKINQDALERFFGTICQAGGANDHPATPTFLQLYKMLSVYSILKPPKTGNCTIENNKPSQNLISLDSIKTIYYSPEKNKPLLYKIREKLDFAIQHDDWSLDDIISPSDHNYYVAPLIDCVIYYVTGCLCKQIVSYFKCVTCQSAIKQNMCSYEPVARLIEQLFSKYCKMADVLELILTELLDDTLYFPCFQHSEEILAFTIN
ncbi:hypothetical protein AGLY_016703 [Aphis glycines]|uniref:Transposable element P transposase-like RNase H C-terminal domain-containing protein n=1 Tax=Aphis glycines TaxID=307491 RepID=A0A6G0SXA2_APHGL|nr:hypothetical protein AGLY_016703 [Aphis glycines]